MSASSLGRVKTLCWRVSQHRDLGECLSCGVQAGYRDQLCEFSKVLGGGCEQELVARTGGSAETKPIEFEDTLEVGEQHLDLLA
jgi:hypothetical protein